MSEVKAASLRPITEPRAATRKDGMNALAAVSDQVRRSGRRARRHESRGGGIERFGKKTLCCLDLEAKLKFIDQSFEHASPEDQDSINDLLDIQIQISEQAIALLPGGGPAGPGSNERCHRNLD